MPGHQPGPPPGTALSPIRTGTAGRSWAPNPQHRRKNMDFRRSTSLLLFCCSLFALTTLAPLAFAQNCLQDEFNAAGFHQKLNCTANDVRIAQALNPRAPDGTPITTCFAGTTFSFIADFQVVTTATSRENIGLYMATGGQSSALTGQCVDNIISPLHLAGDNQTCTAG